MLNVSHFYADICCPNVLETTSQSVNRNWLDSLESLIYILQKAFCFVFWLTLRSSAALCQIYLYKWHIKTFNKARNLSIAWSYLILVNWCVLSDFLSSRFTTAGRKCDTVGLQLSKHSPPRPEILCTHRAQRTFCEGPRSRHKDGWSNQARVHVGTAVRIWQETTPSAETIKLWRTDTSSG